MLSSNDSIRFRMKLAAVLALVPVAGYLITRLYIVQVESHDEYLKKARARYTATRVTSGKRGEIFDASGNLLVSNSPCVAITADPGNLAGEAQRRKLAFILAKHLGRDYNYFYKRLNPLRPKRGAKGEVLTNPDGTPVMVPSRYAVIEKRASLEEAAKIRAQVRINRINALFFRDGYMRTYPKGAMLSNVLGYTNVVDDSDVPQIGLEKQLNRQMTGDTGQERYERTLDGLPLSYGLHELIKESRDGRNIYLTIREPIQAILEEELDATYAKWNPATLYAAIADPKTGNILAIAQRPTFNPNIRSTYTPAAVRTRIAEDGFEPGSIIKPFTIGKALDWGVVTPAARFSSLRQTDCGRSDSEIQQRRHGESGDDARRTAGVPCVEAVRLRTENRSAVSDGDQRSAAAGASVGRSFDHPFPDRLRGSGFAASDAPRLLCAGERREDADTAAD